MRWLGLLLTAAWIIAAPTAQAQPDPSPVLKGYVGEVGGTGPYPARALFEASLPTHTMYRPVAPPKAPMPIIAWANGACADNGLMFEPFLREIASHGYLVVAIGPPRQRTPTAPPTAPSPSGPQAGMDPTQSSQLIDALNWAEAENGKARSPLAGRLDVKKVAVMGQSCGGLQALDVSPDPRVTTTVIWNSGVYNRPGGRSGVRISKDKLKDLHAPIAYFIGGPGDIAFPNAADDFARIEGVPAFMGNLPVGHSGTYREPNGGRLGPVAVAWLDWRLKGDAKAARMFEGKACGLCRQPDWTVAKKNMR